MILKPATALTTYADPAALARWLESAAPNASVIYACGPHLGKHPTAALVRDWADADKLLVWSDPSPNRVGCKDYKARRLADAPRTGFPTGTDSGDPLDNPAFTASPAGKVYAVLADCAARGLACPSNEELAEMCGLKNRDAAQYLLRGKLEKAGLIRVIEPNRYSARVIEICASGKRTGSAGAAPAKPAGPLSGRENGERPPGQGELGDISAGVASSAAGGRHKTERV